VRTKVEGNKVALVGEWGRILVGLEWELDGLLWEDWYLIRLELGRGRRFIGMPCGLCCVKASVNGIVVML